MELVCNEPTWSDSGLPSRKYAEDDECNPLLGDECEEDDEEVEDPNANPGHARSVASVMPSRRRKIVSENLDPDLSTNLEAAMYPVDPNAILPLPTMNWREPVGNAGLQKITDSSGRKHSVNPSQIVRCYESESSIDGSATITIVLTDGVQLVIDPDEAKRSGLAVNCAGDSALDDLARDDDLLIPPSLTDIIRNERRHPTYASFGRGDSDVVDPRAILPLPKLF